MILTKYPVRLTFTDRELLIFVYREHEKRVAVLSKQEVPSKVKEWKGKVNEMVVVFNRLKIKEATPMTQLQGNSKSKSLDKLIKYVNNEVINRVKFYPGWIQQKRMSKADADHGIKGMKAVYNKRLDLRHENGGEQSALFDSDQ